MEIIPVEKKDPITPHEYLKELKQRGINKFLLFYTKEVDGKRVPNKMTIWITLGVLTAAAFGAYKFHKHKKKVGLVKKTDPLANPRRDLMVRP